MARIDPDDRSTWPVEVAQVVQRAAAAFRGSVQYAYQIRNPEAEESFRGLLRGSTIRAYHCTRLLEPELAVIRAQGLRKLTMELLRERIDRALQCKAITRAEAEHFRNGHAFAIGAEKGREGKVCLFSCRPTANDAHSLENLLGIWGGEAIYSAVGTEWEKRLRTLGRPAIVAVDVDLSQEADEGKHYISPGVLSSFVGLELGLEEPALEIHFRRDIPAAQVADIWSPGHPEYDRLPGLPR